jgi:hypothetical protein
MIDELPPAHAPQPWREFRAASKHQWAIPLLYIDWLCAHAAWRLSQWSLLRLLAYAETFSVLIALIVWVAEAHERKQQKHYQAWQVINTAQGKGGSGGRVDALEQLNDDHVPLVGVDVADAFLQDVDLEKADLGRATFRGADMRNAHLRRAKLEDANLTFANLRKGDLRNVNLTNATLADADLTEADLRKTNLHGTTLDRADLRGVNLDDVVDWKAIGSIRLANIQGIKNAPEGFVKWATEHGAVQVESTEKWNAAIEAAKGK